LDDTTALIEVENAHAISRHCADFDLQ
jgi:hypothetical protein